MTHIRIATGAEQPINRTANVAAATFEEGDPVGYDGDGKLVKADAAAGTAIQAVGIAMAPVEDLANYSGSPDVVQAIVESERALINRERLTFGRYGFLLENADEDWNFTKGEPVYLAEGGGYTQTAPSDAGDLVQVLGVAVEDGEVVFVDVEAAYTTV